MMKKFLSLILVLGLSATLLAGCGGSKTETPAASSDSSSSTSTEQSADAGYDKLNIIAAHGASEATSEHASFVKFKELVEERSGGNVVIDIYPNQQMGGDREYTDAAVQGNVTMGGPSTANIARFVPALNAFETPFLFSDRDTAYKALDSDAGKALLDSLESAGLKGLKIRVMENEVHLAIWTSLGANPSPLAFGELYTALQQKAFDAQENPAELIYNTKFYEVQNHVYKTGHIYTPYIIYMNLNTWNGLNEKTQAMIQECMDEAVAYCRQICAENEQKSFDAITESGKSTVYEISPELRAEMVAACSSVYDLVIEKAGGTYAQDLWAAAGFDPSAVA